MSASPIPLLAPVTSMRGLEMCWERAREVVMVMAAERKRAIDWERDDVVFMIDEQKEKVFARSS